MKTSARAADITRLPPRRKFAVLSKVLAHNLHMHRVEVMTMRYLPLFLALAACPPVTGGGGSDEDWQPVSYIDEGQVCFADQDMEVVVSVTAPDCLSSSCSRDLAGECTAVVDGTTITLTSDIHWEQNIGEKVACTEDCGAPTVECTISDLPDGTYTVTLGGVESTLIVPITEPCNTF